MLENLLLGGTPVGYVQRLNSGPLNPGPPDFKSSA